VWLRRARRSAVTDHHRVGLSTDGPVKKGVDEPGGPDGRVTSRPVLGSLAFPAPDDLVKLPVTARALHVLNLIGKTPSKYTSRSHTARAQVREHWGTSGLGRPHLAPAVQRHDYERAISEAFDWLYVEGLTSKIAEPPRNYPHEDWFAITERGRRFLDHGDAALEHHRAEQLLAFPLHPAIDKRARELFLLGETEAAVMIAMKEVEVHMRGIAGLSNDLVGVKLARAAFKPDGGPLTDPAAEPGERVATMELFAGAMGTLRNPVAHRRVDYDDPVQAVEVILFADLLLRMIDRANDARA
jgi:uncharacterized protein (TIGR02391 family)